MAMISLTFDDDQRVQNKRHRMIGLKNSLIANFSEEEKSHEKYIAKRLKDTCSSFHCTLNKGSLLWEVDAVFKLNAKTYINSLQIIKSSEFLRAHNFFMPEMGKLHLLCYGLLSLIFLI